MADSESESEEGSSIIVVDPDPGSRNASEDLEDDFERQIIAMDSVDFDIDSSEDIQEASVYIITWDLGVRCGADLLEEVRIHPLLATKTVLIATADPTPGLVRCALELGADGVCMKPYDAEEISNLLERADANRARKAA